VKKRTIRSLGCLLGLSALAMLGGCAKTLVFATGTTFGLDISQRPDQTINVTLGYDRAEIASIPAPQKADATKDDDTYAVLGIFNVHYGNPFRGDPLTLHQFFATGLAAQEAAKRPQLREFFGKKAGEISRQSKEKVQ